MNKAKSFIKQFVAVVKGDDAEATAQKALRQADSGLKAEIASLTGDTVAFEEAVENAEENLTLATVNHGKLITSRKDYVANLLRAKNDLTDAQDKLTAHLEKIKFLQEQLDNLSDEVKA
jgi:chromosome segregation ATPase